MCKNLNNINLFIGILFGTMGGAIGLALGSNTLGAGLGLAAIIIIPLLYGIFGFIAGAIAALIYNLAAKWIGGLEIETEA